MEESAARGSGGEAGFLGVGGQAYPTGCKEYFRVDERRGVVHIRMFTLSEALKRVEDESDGARAAAAGACQRAAFWLSGEVKGSCWKKLCRRSRGDYEQPRQRQLATRSPSRALLRSYPWNVGPQFFPAACLFTFTG